MKGIKLGTFIFAYKKAGSNLFIHSLCSLTKDQCSSIFESPEGPGSAEKRKGTHL